MSDSTVQRLGDIERALLGSVPLSDCLRMCLALGNNIHSQRLRDWAQRELNGYRPSDTLPVYRTVGAALTGDVHRGPAHGQSEQVAWELVPEETQQQMLEMNGHEVRFSIAETRAIIDRANLHSKGLITMGVPDEITLRAAVNENATDVVYNRVYWCVTASAYEGLLDRVRTTAVSIVTDVLAAIGSDSVGRPLSAAADQAVVLNVSGSGNRVTVRQAGHGDTGALASESDDEVARESLRWTRRQTLWTIAGFILAAGVAAITFALS